MKLMRYLPRFQRAYQELETLAVREGWSRSETEAFQLDRLNAVWQDAIAHVPYYRHLAAEHDLPPRFSSLAEFRSVVPVLPKSAVRSQPRAFLSERAHRGRWGYTSGSTGTPMSNYWGNDAHREALRTKYRLYAMWGLDIFDRMAFLWGDSDVNAPGLAGRIARLRRPLEDRLRDRIRLPAYYVGHDDLRDYLRRIAAFRPAAIYAYSKSAYLLALEAQAMDFHCASLRLIILSSETASPRMISEVERSFGVPAIVEYGSMECGLIAGEWPDRTLRVREDLVLVETLPRDDGRFDIVPTVLTNPSFPLIRYSIGDITDAPLEVPARDPAILKNIAGRDHDLIISQSGRRIHGTCIEDVLQEDRAIRRFRVHQGADGALLDFGGSQRFFRLTGHGVARTEAQESRRRLPGQAGSRRRAPPNRFRQAPQCHLGFRRQIVVDRDRCYENCQADVPWVGVASEGCQVTPTFAARLSDTNSSEAGWATASVDGPLGGRKPRTGAVPRGHPRSSHFRSYSWSWSR